MTNRAAARQGETYAEARADAACERRAHAHRAVWRRALPLGIGLALALASGACRGTSPPAVAVAPPTLAPTATPRPTSTPRPTALPVTRAPAPTQAAVRGGTVASEVAPAEQGPLDAAQARLEALARGLFADKYRSANVARMSQRAVANEAIQGRVSTVRAPGRPLLTYATVAFNYGPYGDGKALAKGVAREFEVLAPRVFEIPEVEQLELLAYVTFRDRTGRFSTGPGVMLGISRQAAEQVDWSKPDQDWDQFMRKQDPMRNLLWIDERLTTPPPR